MLEELEPDAEAFDPGRPILQLCSGPGLLPHLSLWTEVVLRTAPASVSVRGCAINLIYHHYP